MPPIAEAPPVAPDEKQTVSRPVLRADEWWDSLGRVPLHRILFDPPPGTVTLEDYIHRGGRVNGRLVELIDNTLVEKPMGMLEGAIAATLIRILGTFIHEHKLGLVAGADGMLRMVGGNVRLPDVSFIASADLDREELRTQAAPQFRPTLAVEVISEGNTAAEIDNKLRDHFESGCRMVWVLYPANRTLRVYESPDKFRQLTAEDTLDGGDVLPGFSVQVGELFDV